MMFPLNLLVFAIPFKIIIGCVYLEVEDGLIKGRLAQIPQSNKTFYAFQQIPYAAPPVNKLRFQPPQPVEKWNGTLDATKNTKICYQVTDNSTLETEDCLYLNVYTPKLPSETNTNYLPVMVYIHGGGYVSGDATHKSLGPEFLVTYDVIVVTLNYRLGPFGFLSTEDSVLPGNNGLKDQLFALQWINRNIQLFGGDVEKITLFGQSAGAASIGYHLISKKAQGLYRAAIMESSSPLCPFSYQRKAKYYAFRTASLVDSKITNTSSSEEILNTLMTASAEEIDLASGTINAEEYYTDVQLFQGFYYAPVIEPESSHSILTKNMFEAIETGSADPVPLIMGINSEEGLGHTTDIDYLKHWMALYDTDLKALVPHDMNIDSDDVLENVGHEIRTIYSGDGLLQTDPASGARYSSDTSFTRAVIKHAELQAQFSPIYFYQFSYDGKLGNVSVIIEGADRVGHNEELAYIWRIDNAIFYNYNLDDFPISDIITHNRILTMWTNFAKTLNPTPEKIDLLENILWPKVEGTANNFSYLNINDTLEIKKGPKSNSFSSWEQLYQNYGHRPFNTY